MSLPQTGNSATGSPFNSLHEKDALYSVLNLPTCASDNEIRERYRALSVIFHPDKQRIDTTRETANKRFLEIQKAYEVLSDPFLRRVYDVFGYEGLNMQWPPELRSKPVDELRGVFAEAQRKELEDLVRPRGSLTLGINARSLFESDPLPQRGRNWTSNAAKRIRDINVSAFAVRYRVQTNLNERTTVTLAPKLEASGSSQGLRGGSLLGTVWHQYSPRLSYEATVSLLRARQISLKATYNGNHGGFLVRTTFSSFLRQRLPPFTIQYSQRLFRRSLTEGTIQLYTGPQPYLNLSIASPTPFGKRDHESEPIRTGSATGFGTGIYQRSFGVTIAGLASGAKVEWGVVFGELAVQAKVGLQLGLTGLQWVLSGVWGDDQGGVTVAVALGANGVLLMADFAYVGQHFNVPIALSEEFDAPLAFYTALLPTTAFVVAYEFILKPRRREQRAAIFRIARKELADEQSSSMRELAETISLLKDTARKHMSAEAAVDGLVIQEATYGPGLDADPEARNLSVDVTIPVQALVHRSQLYIPGHRTKATLQGFYDPAPSFVKTLRVRYLFRGRAHYAEIPDYVPVVLPLEGHLVEA